MIGNDAKNLKKAVKIIEPYADIIDFNFGCPDSDVSELKMGAYMMKHPEKIGNIISAAIKCTDKPVTAKIRLGWDETHINFLKVAKIIEDAGDSAIALHARTREQKYSGNADWSAIKQLKENIKIPVIGNGDIDSGKKAVEMLTTTGCDFVMIGRAAMGNPLIFKECNAAIEGNLYFPSLDEKHDALKRFLNLYEASKQRDDVASIREYIMWSLKGMKGAKTARARLMRIKDKESIIKVVETFF